jgi:hypothetical protein
LAAATRGVTGRVLVGSLRQLLFKIPIKLVAGLGEPHRGYPPKMPESRELERNNTKKERKSSGSIRTTEALLTAIFLVVGMAAGATALGMFIEERINDTRKAVSPDTSDKTNYPNPFEMQYVLPDWNRQGLYPEVLYNVAIDMHSKSFSAHVPIKTHAALAFAKSSVPSYYLIPDTMYVYFAGSHNLPKQSTGLGSGSVHGYIVANKTSEDDIKIIYEGTTILQYEMSGQFPVYVTYISPAVERYDPTLIQKSPTVNIASEEATNVYFQQQEAERNERHLTISNLAIIFASFMITIPAVPRIVRLMYNGKDVTNAEDSSKDKKG